MIKTHDGRGSIYVQGPLGCSSSGTYSFTGGGYSNYPGGYSAGILSGIFNDACDSYSTVGAGDYNVIGGSDNNYAYNAAVVSGLSNGIVGSAGAIIGGGLNNLISNAAPSPYYNSNLSAIAAGNTNVIASPNSFIGAGYNNSIVSPAFKVSETPDDFIGAGYGNSIAADFSVVAGGYGNAVTGEDATISGGATNDVSGAFSAVVGGSTNSAAGQYSSIVGGYQNSDSGNYGFLGGGIANNITGEYSTIAGGQKNVASGLTSTVGGGYTNIASGQNATIPGGGSNVAAGRNSFAAGYLAQALNDGTFAWGDFSAGAKTVSSSASNQFLARASGGFFLYSSANLKSGVKLAPGSGSWSSLSDRAAKIGIADIDNARILAKVVSLPVSEWSYTAQGTAIRHLGPMAQDFRAAFGLGEDDRHITSIDEEGVALAAIKALQAQVAEKDRKLNDLGTKFARLEQRLNALEKRT